MTKKTYSKADTALHRWIEDNGVDRQDFAAEMGCSYSTLARLCLGYSTPRAELAARIEARTGITMGQMYADRVNRAEAEECAS